VGGAGQRILGRHSSGGSLALGELIDEHGEALFVDLLKVYGFNLASYMAGDVAGSPRLILSLIRHLPEGSHYVAILQSAPVENGPAKDKPTEIDPVLENQTWTTDRMLIAQLINSVNMLVRHSIQWQKDQAPNLPIIGPSAWRGEGADAPPARPLTVMDVINNVMGH
jgi:hypothetical protein